MVEIEKGVPLPPPGKSSGRPSLLPLESMEVGDRIIVDHLKESSIRPMVSRRNNMADGKRFTIRKLDKDKFGVWRVE